MGAVISENKIDVIILDLLNVIPHDPDVKALLPLATVRNIHVATNRPTADFLMSSVLFYQGVVIAIPDYQRYLTEYFPSQRSPLHIRRAGTCLAMLRHEATCAVQDFLACGTPDSALHL